jgi:hypothetical protein
MFYSKRDASLNSIAASGSGTTFILIVVVPLEDKDASAN